MFAPQIIYLHSTDSAAWPLLWSSFPIAQIAVIYLFIWVKASDRWGVSLFYGLSGLLMARLYLDRTLDRKTLAEFLLRRGARVLPLYYFSLFLAICLLFIGLNPYRLETLQDLVLAAVLTYGTGVLWSIPVEIQFYLVFAVVWFFSAKGKFLLILAVLAALQAALVGWQVSSGMRNFYNLSFWLHIFLIGVILGRLSTSERFATFCATHRNKFNLLALLILLMTAIAPPGVRDLIGLPKTYPFLDPISVGYPMALLLISLIDLRLFHFLRHSILIWLGKISFSIYLLHMPVIYMAEFLLADMNFGTWQMLIVIFSLTLIVSALTAKIIERRCQISLLRYFRSRVAPT